jgi:hypothetical protein
MTEWLDRTRTVVYPIPTRASTLLAPAVGNLAPRPPPPCCKLLGAWSERLQGQGQVGTKTGARDVGARRVTVLYDWGLAASGATIHSTRPSTERGPRLWLRKVGRKPRNW